MRSFSIFAIFATALLCSSAQAHFVCFSAEKGTANMPQYVINVYDKTADQPNVTISLLDADYEKLPKSFLCETAVFSNDGATHTEYSCEAQDTHLSVYTTQKKAHFSANLYSKELGLNLESMTCETM